MLKREDVLFNALRVPLDFGLLLAAGIMTYFTRTRILDAWRPVLFGPELSLGRFFSLTAIVSGLFVLSYAISGLYSMKLRMGRAAEIARVIVASSAAIMVVISVIFLRQELFNSRFLVIGYWIVATLLVVAGRLAFRTLHIRVMAASGMGSHRVLLIGDDDITERLDRDIGANPGLGYRVVKRLADPDLAEVSAAVGNPGVDEILLANPNYPAERVVQLVDFCNERHILFTFVPNIHRTLTTHWDVDAIGQIPIVQLRRTALTGWGRIFKRITDIAASAAALVLLSPFFAVIAFAIKWETAGPVFARLRRVSRNQQFNLYKFRSMVENAEELKPLLEKYNERADGPLFKMKDDPRVTGVGRFIRKFRLDELPQFWNILKGDIALVGPRPHQPDEIAKYAKHHKKLLAIKAGATGLAQVSGSSDLPFEEEVVLDTFYIENWTLGLDARIVFRTILKMFRDRSAV